MNADSWVVLEEHLMPVSWVPIDSGSERLLFIEALLKDQGIEVGFDPFRPGEGSGFSRACAQPVRLMVKAVDVERARRIVDEARIPDSESAS